MSKIYTTQEVADLMKVSVWTVNKWIRQGRLNATLIGRAYRITAKDLGEFWAKSGGNSEDL